MQSFQLLFLYEQRSEFASTVSKCRGFCRGITMFFSICLSKKNAKAIEFFGLIKKYFSKNKKKLNVFLKTKIFVFHMIFKLDCITQIIYFIIHICLYSLFILLLFPYISLQETGHRKNTNPSLLMKVSKNQNEWKKA